MHLEKKRDGEYAVYDRDGTWHGYVRIVRREMGGAERIWGGVTAQGAVIDAEESDYGNPDAVSSVAAAVIRQHRRDQRSG